MVSIISMATCPQRPAENDGALNGERRQNILHRCGKAVEHRRRRIEGVLGIAMADESPARSASCVAADSRPNCRSNASLDADAPCSITTGRPEPPPSMTATLPKRVLIVDLAEPIRISTCVD